MLRFCGLVLVVVAVSLVSSIEAQAESADGAGAEWKPLFNGRDLEGWTPKIKGYPLGENYANTFRVEEGVLKVVYDGYSGFENRFGHLFYQHPYSHYVLRLEYRFIGDQVPGGPGWAVRNSGIMVHGQKPETMRVDQDFPVSIEVQLLGGAATGERSTANVCTPGTNIVMGEKLIERHCNSSQSMTYRGDQWVTVEVEVRGHESITHRVNGQTVLVYHQPQLDPKDEDARRLIQNGEKRLFGGTISLQSESHPVEFRRVEIRELSP